MSLKPFWDNSPETRDAVCRELFAQWRPIARFAETVSVMLWIGDGSEILEYEGDADTAFEWGRHHGCVNAVGHHAMLGARDSGRPDHDAIGLDSKLRDPEARGVHRRSYLYRPQPAVFTYAWLQQTVEVLKVIGREVTGKPVLVGATFDIGPEFAASRFKYEWHQEICGGGSLFGGKFIRCNARLHADKRRYAAFPDGIAEGTPFGTFLGAQCRRFLGDCGYDFLWLSNGFGFALEPWALTGALFDGNRFDTARAAETSRSILEFWRQFRAEVPAARLRTRGTNLCTGIDLGSDASPLREIYAEIAGVEPPVNSPWAALDGDLGLELAGWMSHMARTPVDKQGLSSGYRFRYYIHDPWWLNSPWLDRYQRQPYDIYLPLSVSRLLPNGTVQPPCDLSLLTVDDSHGCMPPSVPVEVTAHILHAREFAPDAPGPVVWVYPFDAYHDMTTGPAARPDIPFFGDWCVRGMIAHGVPVNTVADARDLPAILETAALSGSVLLAPALKDATLPHLLCFAERGGNVLLYGPLRDCPRLLELLHLVVHEDLEGDFRADCPAVGPDLIRHHSLLSGGGWAETPAPDTDAEVPAGAQVSYGHVTAYQQVAWNPEPMEVNAQSGRRRAVSAWRRMPGGGLLAWVRGSQATAEYNPQAPGPVKGPRLEDPDPQRFIPAGEIAGVTLGSLGLAVQFPPGIAKPPVVTIHRHRNSFVFSGYQRVNLEPHEKDIPIAPAQGAAFATESCPALSISLRPGAPVFAGQSNWVDGNRLIWSATPGTAGPPWWHHVVRAFVRQGMPGAVVCRILPPIQHGYTSRMLLSGLRGAEVRFFPEPGSEARLEILTQPKFPYFQGDFIPARVETTSDGPCVVVTGVEGELLFSW
ncbi:hypothetical protein DB346_02275 [Verrucomicrobia bacterium LW23]|nr:hypothetical protein DB346_02275 [Verrucomicrobia bacterium LW23]